MVWLGLLLVVLSLLALRQSLILVLAVASAYVHLFVANSKIEFLIQDFWFTVDREVLLSVPLFMLAGNLMSRGSIARRLIDLMSAFTTPIPGGLAIACVLACGAFAAINGSSIVTMLAVGSIMYPALIARGYSTQFSVGVIASAGTLGIIIPPSIPLILYGIMTEDNISELFVAGIGPGLLLLVMLILYSYWVNRHIARFPLSMKTATAAVAGGVFAIMLPFIMIGGIYSGWFSPTEAGAIALAYALVIEFFVHSKDGAKPVSPDASFGRKIQHYFFTRQMSPRALVEVIIETTRMLATLLPLLCVAGSLSTILDHSGIPKQLVETMSVAVGSPGMMMFGINLLLLVAGCLIDVGSAIMILAPILKPLAVAIGTDPIHFGIIMIANLELGYLTPPVGLNLIVAMAAFKVPFGVVIRAVLPFILIMGTWLVLVVLYPTISLGLLSR